MLHAWLPQERIQGPCALVSLHPQCSTCLCRDTVTKHKDNESNEGAQGLIMMFHARLATAPLSSLPRSKLMKQSKQTKGESVHLRQSI